MRNWLSYIVGLILVGLASLPFLDIKVMAPGEWFPWFYFIAGTLAFLTFFIKVSAWVRVFAVFGLFNSFASSVPLASFIAYFQLIACLYFYILCQHIKNYDPIFKMLQAFVLFNCFLIIMQIFNRDPLLNFNSDVYFGTIGQHMQMGSFSVIITAALLLNGAILNFGFPMLVSACCNSAGAFISVASGLSFYLFKFFSKLTIFKITGLLLMVFLLWMIIGGKFSENTSLRAGRLGVWINTFKLCLEHPFIGWGIGTYKVLFPTLGGISTIAWKNVHNCWLQIIFETGFIGFSLVVGYVWFTVVSLMRLLRRAILKEKAFLCLAALIIVGVNMMFHFPTRMIQTVPLIIFILAYSGKVVNYGTKQA